MNFVSHLLIGLSKLQLHCNVVENLKYNFCKTAMAHSDWYCKHSKFKNGLHPP